MLTPEQRRENHNASNAAWREKNPDYFKDWAKENAEHLAEYQARYHQEVRKADYPKLHKQRKTSYKKLREQVKEILGNECKHCGNRDSRVLCVDHVNGGGNIEVREIGWWKILSSIRDLGDQGKYQLLCANCNLIKRIENKEHGKGRPGCL